MCDDVDAGPTEADEDMADSILIAFEEEGLSKSKATTEWVDGAWEVVTEAGGRWSALELDGWVFAIITPEK